MCMRCDVGSKYRSRFGCFHICQPSQNMPLSMVKYVSVKYLCANNSNEKRYFRWDNRHIHIMRMQRMLSMKNTKLTVREIRNLCNHKNVYYTLYLSWFLWVVTIFFIYCFFFLVLYIYCIRSIFWGILLVMAIHFNHGEKNLELFSGWTSISWIQNSFNSTWYSLLLKKKPQLLTKWT